MSIFNNRTTDFEIEDGVLKKYTGTSVTVRIPEGITKIGTCAFQKAKIKRVHLPDSIRELGWCCFSGCTELEHINIPANIKQASQAFSMCSSIKSAGTSTDCNMVLDNDMEAIPDKFFHTLICLSDVSLPEKIRSIGKEAFHYCEQLKTITLPRNLKHIGEYAFSSCSELE